MSGDRTRYLDLAAGCYERAGLFGDAARCREEAGVLFAAALLYVRAGDPARAAECYERGRYPAEAADLLLRLGRAEEAAGCWERAGERVTAAWLLLVHTRRFRHARWLLDGPGERGPRHELALALAEVREGAGEARLEQVVEQLVTGDALRSDTAARRAELRDRAVAAADLAGRRDLAATVFAAAYGIDGDSVLPAWRAWAEEAMGGTLGLPGELRTQEHSRTQEHGSAA
jgi:tetratricopeptide (TPR) repeat protein